MSKIWNIEDVQTELIPSSDFLPDKTGRRRLIENVLIWVRVEGYILRIGRFGEIIEGCEFCSDCGEYKLTKRQAKRFKEVFGGRKQRCTCDSLGSCEEDIEC
jgi:hypothetical protein